MANAAASATPAQRDVTVPAALRIHTTTAGATVTTVVATIICGQCARALMASPTASVPVDAPPWPAADAAEANYARVALHGRSATRRRELARRSRAGPWRGTRTRLQSSTSSRSGLLDRAARCKQSDQGVFASALRNVCLERRALKDPR